MDSDATKQDVKKLGTALWNAIDAGNDDLARELIADGAPVWIQDGETGWSPLHYAAEAEKTALVQFLLREGATWNAGSS